MIMGLNKYIEHTALKPDVGREELEKLCMEAAEYDFASVCVNPCNVAYVKELLKNTDVNVCTVIGFPLGANTSEIKAYETEVAYKHGCDEFDMVINVGALKAGLYEYVYNDIKAVVAAAKGKTVKVIIETGLLTDSEKVAAVKLSCQAGAHFVKTCTGFSKGVATVEDVTLMKKNVSGDVKVKASAGIRDHEAAIALIKAGADRLGTSAGVAIIEGMINA